MHYKEERDTEPVPTHLSLVVYKDKDPPQKSNDLRNQPRQRT